jgi:hypothetical protein
MRKAIKNLKILTLSLIALVLFIVAINPGISTVKAQTQDSVYVYTSVGGTISSTGTNLTGGTSYNYTNGQAVSFTAQPDAGCKFLFWTSASPSGTNISTDNPFVYNISSTECAIQAMFIPSANTSIASSSSQTGTAPFDVPISLGGTTTPATGIYTNYSIGQVVSFTADPGSGFKFLYWLVPAATGGAVSIVTSNTLDFNVTANACAIQAFFAPTNSNITLPSIPTVNEFSSAATILVVAILVIVAFGTYRYTKKTKC